MNYEEALDFIHSTYKFGSKLGLHNISKLLELLGDPHKKLKFVHVAGTNGKGSTTAFISSILKAAGYRVGIYTSPYIQHFTERIKINDIEIVQERLAQITSKIKDAIDIMLSEGYNHPTEFEVVTAIGMLYYYEERCDIVVLEVGLGGRFDATNIIDCPEVAVITSISYDHMAILGDTLPKIAFEKAGIIKNGCDCVFYEQSDEVAKVIEDACREREARLTKVDFGKLQLHEFSVDGQVFSYGTMKNLKITLLGDHQLKNACTAIEVALILKNKGYNITNSDIYDGLLSTLWAGRLEVLSKNPLVLIDGAHNEDGAKTLMEAIKKYFPGYKVTFIMGVLRDKEYTKLIRLAADIADKFIAITVPNPRTLYSEELFTELTKYCGNVYKSDTIKGAIDLALSEREEKELICAFGSLYFIGEVREYFIYY